VPIRKSSTSIPDDLAFAMRQGGGPLGLSYTDTATRLRMNSTHIANPIFKLKNFGDDVYAASFAVHFLLALVPAKVRNINIHNLSRYFFHIILDVISKLKNNNCFFVAKFYHRFTI